MPNHLASDQTAILQRILEISLRMAETRELDPLLEYVMQQALGFTNGEHGYLVLLNDDDSLDFRITHGHPYEGDNQGTPVSRSIIEQVVREGKAALVRDAFGDSRFQTTASVVRMRLRSVLCVPLAVQGELLGVLYIENRKVADAFTENDVPLVMIFASQAATAIKNAQLNEQLEARVRQRTAELDKSRLEAEAGWAAALEENHLRTALLSNITHDLRSPLNIVINAIEWMQMGEFGEINQDQHDWLERALKATQQVLRLVNDIFDLSKIEQGKLELYFKEVEISPLLDHTLAIAQGLRRSETVELLLDAQPNLPAIWADPDRIQQILVNLFSNAFKYTQEGKVTIRARYNELTDSILFEVADSGQGIPSHLVSRVFDRFQHDDSPEMRRRGTGLGLAICKELVERHQGQIGVESELGVGTTFFFTIPVARN